MDAAAFEALVTRTEALAARRPRAYRWWVFALAVFGYLYIAFIVGVLGVLFILALVSIVFLKALAIKLVAIVVAPLWLMLRSLWVRMDAPSGLRLTRRNAPRLFQMLDGLRRQLRTPRVHVVLLGGDLNAAVAQVPRLGLFGWHRNYLALGLPLMKALSVEQFRAVLAHELGHLSGGHARTGNWIYRLRRIWKGLDGAFERAGTWGAVLVQPFFKRYIPYFEATSFPLARANEYEADGTSVRLTSAHSAAQALTITSVLATYLSRRYWPGIHAKARELPQPTLAPYTDFVATAVHEIPAEELQSWQEAALAARTSHDDTHPALADRLKAMGAEAEFAPPAPGESAAMLLEPERTRLEEALDEIWRRGVSEAWSSTYQRAQAARLRLGELRSQAQRQELDEGEAVELADLEEALGDGGAVALALRRGLAARYPGSLRARFELAGQLLRTGNADGVVLMESVIAADVDALVPGGEILRDFYARQDDMPRAIEWHTRAAERAQLLEAARRERDCWLINDTLVAHGVAAEALGRLIGQLKAIPDLTGAFIARKLVVHFPDQPMYVLGFKVRHWWSLADKAKAHAVLMRIRQEVVFPGETLIASIEGRNAAFAKRLRRVPGARIL